MYSLTKFPAADGTPSAPADDQHSRQWCAQNGRGRVHGSATGEVQRPSAPGRLAGESPPPPRRTPRWTIGRRRGGMGAWNGGQWPGLRRRGAPVKADMQRDGGTRSPTEPTECWVWETTGPPSDALGWWRSAHLMSALTRLWTVIFLVFFIHCRGRLKRPFLLCRADSVA